MQTQSSKRAIALSLVALFLSVGCGGNAGPEAQSSPSPNPGSIAALRQGAVPLQLLLAQSYLPPGTSLFTFGLVNAQGQPASGGSPSVWIARDESSAATGPVPATFHEFTASDRFPNDAPRSGLTGFYAVSLDISEPGNWAVAALVTADGQSAVGTGFLRVAEDRTATAVGTAALSVDNESAWAQPADQDKRSEEAFYVRFRLLIADRCCSSFLDVLRPVCGLESLIERISKEFPCPPSFGRQKATVQRVLQKPG